MSGLVRYETDFDYPDTGCDLAPECLNCHLPECKYDAPKAIKGLVRYGDTAPRYRPHEIPEHVRKPSGLPSLRRGI